MDEHANEEQCVVGCGLASNADRRQVRRTVLASEQSAAIHAATAADVSDPEGLPEDTYRGVMRGRGHALLAVFILLPSLTVLSGAEPLDVGSAKQVFIDGRFVTMPEPARDNDEKRTNRGEHGRHRW